MFFDVHSTVDLHVATAKMSSRNIVGLSFLFHQEINVQGVVGKYDKAFCVCLPTVMVMSCSVTANDDPKKKHHTPSISIQLSNLVNWKIGGRWTVSLLPFPLTD